MRDRLPEATKGKKYIQKNHGSIINTGTVPANTLCALFRLRDPSGLSLPGETYR